MGKATPDHAALLAKARSKRLGLEGYIRILAYLRPAGATTVQLSAAFDLHHNTAAKLLRYMKHLRLIHRESWVRLVPHGRLVPVWRLGEIGDVSMPIAEARSCRPPNPMMIALASVIQAMQEAPITIAELREDMAMHTESAQRLVSLLRDHGLSRIASWALTNNGLPVAQHGYMIAMDAPRPKRESITTARKRWRQTYSAKQRHIRLIAATSGAAA